MIAPDTVRDIALSFPETDEQPHHDKVAFRVKNKIFATLNAPRCRATLKFSAEMQDIFTRVSQGAIYPVDSAWKKYGWTTVDLQKVHLELLRDAMQIAWRETAPKAFEKKYPEMFADE